MKCCGTYINGTGNDENSWEKYGPYYSHPGGFLVPKSCCMQFEQVDACRKSPLNSQFNVTGCFDKIENTFVLHSSILLLASMTITVIMV